MIPNGSPVRIKNKFLTTINGKIGEVVRSTTLNANNVPGYIVRIDGRDWTLYADEVEAIAP